MKFESFWLIFADGQGMHAQASVRTAGDRRQGEEGTTQEGSRAFEWAADRQT